MKRLVMLVAILGFASIASGQQIVPIVSGVVTMDVSKHQTSFKVIVNQNITSVVFENPTGGEVVNVLFSQDSTGGFTVAFGGNIANSPTISTTPSASSSVLFSYDLNTNAWFGVNNGGLSSPLNIQGLNNTFSTPVLSPAAIENITNSSGISTMNCNITACGLTVSEQLELGTTLPLNCQGPQTISAVSGNTASFPSTSCVASGGPYMNSIGQYASPVQFCNAVSPSSCTQVSLQYDGAFQLLTYGGSTLQSYLNLDTDSVAALVSQNGGSFVTDIEGDTCLVGNALDEHCTHQAEVFNASGKMTRYDTQALDAGPYGHGINADLAELNAGSTTGNYARTTIYRTNGTGNFGGQGWYEVNFQAVESSNVSGGTVTFEVIYTNPDYGTVGATYPVSCNMSFAGTICNWSAPILVAAGTNIDILTRTTNSPIYFFNVMLVGK